MEDQRFRTADAQAIKRLRGEKGWSRETCAEKAGLHPDTIKRAENGARLLLEKLGSIARALGVELRQIILGGDLENLYPSFEVVPTPDQCSSADTADDFYDGFPPLWGHLKAEFDIKRDAYSTGSQL